MFRFRISNSLVMVPPGVIRLLREGSRAEKVAQWVRVLTMQA